MGRMSELDIEIRERTAARQAPAEIAKALGIPVHWAVEIVEENEYNDYLNRRASDEFFAEQSADADAEIYGTR
jgi:uncharacterized glyoxalase superfamily metalloenzyme YdcJ